jgi:hypothetical protein
MPKWEGDGEEGATLPFIGKLGGFDTLDALYAEGEGNEVREETMQRLSCCCHFQDEALDSC